MDLIGDYAGSEPFVVDGTYLSMLKPIGIHIDHVWYAKRSSNSSSMTPSLHWVGKTVCAHMRSGALSLIQPRQTSASKPYMLSILSSAYCMTSQGGRNPSRSSFDTVCTGSFCCQAQNNDDESLAPKLQTIINNNCMHPPEHITSERYESWQPPVRSENRIHP